MDSYDGSPAASGVELSPIGTSSRALSSMQFNRSSSFSASGEVDVTDLSDEQQHYACLEEQDSKCTTAPWSQSGFEPFEVEEQGTEVKFLNNALRKKEEECEHLRGIIKELSHSRHLVAKTKVEVEEQYAALQREYFKVIKVSELARKVSSEAMGRINRIKSELHSTKEELMKVRRRARHATDQVSGLQSENAALRARLDLLEQGMLNEDCKTSVCAREYLYGRVALY